MITEHIVSEEASWDQIRRWDQLRGDMETSIARALQAKLDRLKEKKWLEECEKEMGWGRSAAYYHLNPIALRKKREYDNTYDATQRPRTVDIAADDVEGMIEDLGSIETACELPSQEHDVAMAVMQLNSVLKEGGFTAKRLKEQVVGTGKWKVIDEVRKLIAALTKLQKELEQS